MLLNFEGSGIKKEKRPELKNQITFQLFNILNQLIFIRFIFALIENVHFSKFVKNLINFYNNSQVRACEVVRISR